MPVIIPVASETALTRTELDTIIGQLIGLDSMYKELYASKYNTINTDIAT